MSREFKKGDRVTWKSHCGTAEGEVLRKITEDTELAGRKGTSQQGRSAVPRAQRQERRRGSA
jgi:Hypervirulence associated proteins TUDOR domain